MTICKQLFSAEETAAGIRRVADEIIREFPPADRPFAIVGIHKLGVQLGRRLCAEIATSHGIEPEFGQLDITMYRDDIGTRKLLPQIQETVIPFDVNDREIILVDDVLSSGRTIRAALDALTDYGRPKLIRLAVLVDRGEPEFPIRADFIGIKVALPPEHKVVVRFEPDEDLQCGIYELEWNF